MTEHARGLGRASLEPDADIVAGSFGTWQLIYTAGEGGIAVGGGFRVYTDTDSDWGTPQFVDPAAAEFMTVSAPEGVTAAVRTTGVKSLEVSIHGRDLKLGEQVAVTLGDRSGGGAGSRAQTFAEQTRYFWIDVDPSGEGRWQQLPDSPHVRIVGDEAVRLVAIAPSSVVVGETFELLVKAEDRWGNPAPAYRGTLALEGEEIDSETSQVAFAADDCGVKRIAGLRARESGLFRVAVADARDGLRAESNPIEVLSKPGEHRLYWADPHGGQLVLNPKITDFYWYARDVAGVQFVGYQRNADAMSNEDWRVQQEQELAYHEPGRFVPIPGFEWSGKTWEGGHHNVYFRRHCQPARRNKAHEEMFGQDERAPAELKNIEEVYDHYRQADVIITPHVGGEHSDISHHEPTLEPAVEITSTHGTFEWMLRDALRRRYKLGFLGGSDSYTGRPGDDHPGFQLRRYAKAGLTGIYCRDVSLASFFEAMRARRVYATTGARMILHAEADGHAMGSECATSEPPTIRFSAAGTAGFESVELFRNLERIHSVPLEATTVPNCVRLLFTGSSRMTSYSGVIWDGTLSVNGAKIGRVETLRFDSPRSHVTHQNDGSVSWHAWGCGYPMGLVVDLDATENVSLEVRLGSQTITGPAYGQHGDRAPRRISSAPAEQIAFETSLGQLQSSPVEHALGVLDRKVNLSLACESAPDTAAFQFTDPSPQPGVNAYWVRVLQTDMELGWTSPVFVDYVAGV